MKRSDHRRLILALQISILAGLALAVAWNALSFFLNPDLWWIGLLLPAPGLLGWPFAVLAPKLLSPRSRSAQEQAVSTTFRLLYNSPPSWSSERPQKALLNLIKTGVQLDIIWSRDGEQPGCWLTVNSFAGVLERLIPDVFPEGSLEADVYPEPGEGMVILHWQRDLEAVPTPAELCSMAGIEGVYFRWITENSAIAALWGPQAKEVVGRFAMPGADLPGKGRELLSPAYVGDNPWPNLPPFPSSKQYAGLSSVSHLIRVVPELRINGTLGLVLGKDAEARQVGFTLPGLDGMNLLYVTGQSTEAIMMNLAQQAIQSKRSVFLLDGQGMITTRLSRRLLREVATERVLLCDVERAAQSRFRLNPLWLPTNVNVLPRVFQGWLHWFRELGVTAGGLGLPAYRHTQVAVVLTALMTRQRHMLLDMPRLREALLAPDFLSLIGPNSLPGQDTSLDSEIWDWWLKEGRTTDNFDVHLRLAHLRDRLAALLDTPEYSVLWQEPYLDLMKVISGRQSLFWRLPDPRGRLSAYVSSQLVALHTLLTIWAKPQWPLLIFLHELENIHPWVERLRPFPAVRLVVSTKNVINWPESLKPDSFLVSRLTPEGAEILGPKLVDQAIRPADLRRLPPTRLIYQNRGRLGTVEMDDFNLI